MKMKIKRPAEKVKANNAKWFYRFIFILNIIGILIIGILLFLFVLMSYRSTEKFPWEIISIGIISLFLQYRVTSKFWVYPNKTSSKTNRENSIIKKLYG